MSTDSLRERLERYVGQPLGSGVALAPDPVNLPMIRHWVDALEDRNPVYLDEQAAAKSRFGGIVAPPAMLQAWTMARPEITGIAERGGAAGEIDPDSALGVLAGEGYTATLATNSELEFERYLRVGEQLRSSATLESISESKSTAVGTGYFVTWVTSYLVDDESVGRQTFRVFRFAPGSPTNAGTRRSSDQPASDAAKAVANEGEVLPPFDLDVTATVVVAGAIASRDFMPVHHDRDYAQAQGAPDLFMNILTTNGYIARYVTDWAGPQAALRGISIRLGGPAIPGLMLRFTGQVSAERREGDERHLEVGVRAANDLGDHASGTVTLSLPAQDQSSRSRSSPV
jgi:acyl dehydratase